MPHGEIENIFFPTDFSIAGESAFAHAVKIAIEARGSLHIMQVSTPGSASHGRSSPKVRQTLERWGILSEGSSKRDVASIGLKVRKTLTKGQEPTQAVVHQLAKRQSDLMILATLPGTGLDKWQQKVVENPRARSTGLQTLYIPSAQPGIVSVDFGDVTLNRILVPVAAQPAAEPAIWEGLQFATLLGRQGGECTLLHVGSQSTIPAIEPPEVDEWKFRLMRRPGEAVQEIIKFAREDSTDLIVMSAEGRHGFLDAIRGSTTERLIPDAPCPILAVYTSRP